MSGDRSGGLAVWDINNPNAILTKQAHNAAVAKICMHSDGADQNVVLTSGLKDGKVNVFDMRSN